VGSQGKDGMFLLALESAGIAQNRRVYFRNWLDRYLEFCGMRCLGSGDEGALESFLEGMFKAGKPRFQVEQARAAVELFWLKVLGGGGQVSSGEDVKVPLAKEGMPNIQVRQGAISVERVATVTHTEDRIRDEVAGILKRLEGEARCGAIRRRR
jgi:hypothetical protein